METRVKALAFIPCATGSISLVGSFLTLLTIHRTRRQRYRRSYGDSSCGDDAGSRNKAHLRTYERLLIGISVSDILFSTSLATGPFLLPSSVSIPWAYGTTGTCTFQATFAQLGAASFCYSLMLMVYYILVIRFNKTDSWISTWAEPILHAIPIGFFGSTAIVGLSWQVFNPNGLHCWVGVYPEGCVDDPQVTCQRGEEHVDFFGTWLVVVPFFVINALLVSTLAIIAFTVWQQHTASQGFVVGTNSQRQAKQVIVQCVLYALSFINVMVWSTIGTIFFFANVPFDNTGKHYWIVVLAVIFLPIQGLFNFLVFIRPRYLKKRRDSVSRLVALKEAVWNPLSVSYLSPSSSSSSQRGGSESYFSTTSFAQSIRRRALFLCSFQAAHNNTVYYDDDQRSTNCCRLHPDKSLAQSATSSLPAGQGDDPEETSTSTVQSSAVASSGRSSSSEREVVLEDVETSKG